MSYVFRALLTITSLLLIFSVFLVKNNKLVNLLHKYITNKQLAEWIRTLPNYVSFLLYFFTIVIFTYVSIWFVNFLSYEQISKKAITCVETANDSFLPSYLGYFFVALSINNTPVFIYVFSIIFIFIFFSKISYFNPVFLLFGYNFFYLTDVDGLKILVITKKELKTPREVEFSELKRINNYTFISKEQ